MARDSSLKLLGVDLSVAPVAGRIWLTAAV